MPADVLGARTAVAAHAEAYAVTATDTLVPLVVQRHAVAASTAAGGALVVATGKVLRLQKMALAVTLVGTTPSSTRVRLRIASAAGAVVATSPVFINKRYGGTSALAGHVYDFDEDFPDGLEVPAGFGVGVTAIGTATQHTLDVSLLGFEYNA